MLPCAWLVQSDRRVLSSFVVMLPWASAASYTDMATSTLSMPHIIDINQVFHQHFTWDTAKNCFIVYLLSRRALKLWRHVWARGLTRSFRELYVHIAQVFTFLFPPFLYSDLLFRLRGHFNCSPRCQRFAGKWRQKWNLRESRSRGRSCRRVRTWCVTSPFRGTVVLWNGYSTRWSKWTGRHLRRQISGTENCPAQCTVCIPSRDPQSIPV